MGFRSLSNILEETIALAYESSEEDGQIVEQDLDLSQYEDIMIPVDLKFSMHDLFL